MTTGRINQVTIVPGRAPHASERSPEAKRTAEPGVAKRQGVERSVRLRPGATSRLAPPMEPAGHPIAPTESLGKRSAAEALRAGEGNARAPRHRFPGGRIPAARHALVGGYRHRLTPECLVANSGHRPTVHRLPRRPREGEIPRGFVDSPRNLRPAAGEHGQKELRRESRHGPPPALEPTATNGHCTQLSAEGTEEQLRNGSIVDGRPLETRRPRDRDPPGGSGSAREDSV